MLLDQYFLIISIYLEIYPTQDRIRCFSFILCQILMIIIYIVLYVMKGDFTKGTHDWIYDYYNNSVRFSNKNKKIKVSVAG